MGPSQKCIISIPGEVGQVYICITATPAVAVHRSPSSYLRSLYKRWRKKEGSVHSINAQTIQRGKETVVVMTLFLKRIEMKTALFFIVKERGSIQKLASSYFAHFQRLKTSTFKICFGFNVTYMPFRSLEMSIS